MPEISGIGAQEVSAEIRPDITQFPRRGSLGLSGRNVPANNESASKRKSGHYQAAAAHCEQPAEKRPAESGAKKPLNPV